MLSLGKHLLSSNRRINSIECKTTYVKIISAFPSERTLLEEDFCFSSNDELNNSLQSFINEYNNSRKIIEDKLVPFGDYYYINFKLTQSLFTSQFCYNKKINQNYLEVSYLEPMTNKITTAELYNISRDTSHNFKYLIEHTIEEINNEQTSKKQKINEIKEEGEIDIENTT